MVIELVKTFIIVFLRVEMILMLIRAIMSWLPIGRSGGKAYEIIVMMTEPLIYPARLLFDRLMRRSALPVDVPFIVTYLLIYLLETIIGII